MNTFEWVSPGSVAEAVSALKSAPAASDLDDAARPIAGGQDLLTTMKDYITRPMRVVNLKGIRGLDKIEADGKGGLRIGALVTLAQLEENAIVRRNFPGLSEAAHSVGTQQIRNLGTVGGNLCQRPRCWYFRRSEEHTSELQSRRDLVCRLLLEKKKREKGGISWSTTCGRSPRR